MDKKEEIKILYFEKQYSQKEIAELLNLSKQYISKVLNADEKYKIEKERRKHISRKNHTLKTVDYIKKKRKQQQTSDYEILRQMHKQASLELSERKSINNRAYRNWNSSVYKYNHKTKSYHLKKGIVTGYDVPKKIKWTN